MTAKTEKLTTWEIAALQIALETTIATAPNKLHAASAADLLAKMQRSNGVRLTYREVFQEAKR